MASKVVKSKVMRAAYKCRTPQAKHFRRNLCVFVFVFIRRTRAVGLECVVSSRIFPFRFSHITVGSPSPESCRSSG